uniref:Uncharacterized protein n=1 Tax=Oryza brachyantha TaxID=4533 RepID=J3MB19_ORYBR
MSLGLDLEASVGPRATSLRGHANVREKSRRALPSLRVASFLFLLLARRRAANATDRRSRAAPPLPGSHHQTRRESPSSSPSSGIPSAASTNPRARSPALGRFR